LAKKKFILKSVGSCKSCNIEVINTDSFVIFADRTCQHTTCYEQSETIRQDNIKGKYLLQLNGLKNTIYSEKNISDRINTYKNITNSFSKIEIFFYMRDIYNNGWKSK
jgi:hypothetical protein